MYRPTLGIYTIPDRNNGDYPHAIHDHSICLMQDGQIISYLHLERYTRRKHDNRLHLYLEELIDHKIIQLPDSFDIISVNSFVGQAFISKNGRFRVEISSPLKLNTGIQKAIGWWDSNSKVEFYGISHELAHVFSVLPFFGAIHDNSLLVHFDGGASVSNFSVFHFKNQKLNLIEHHWDLSQASKWYNDNALHFAILNAKKEEHCSIPGKWMGLSGYGKFSPQIAEWLKQNNYFQNIWEDYAPFFKSAEKQFGWQEKYLNTKEPFLQDIAATIQQLFENTLLIKLESLQKKFKSDYLYYTGGCALNIAANSRIINSNLFKQVFIPPCCNDSGLSIGAASFMEWKKNKKIIQHNPYLNILPTNYKENNSTLYAKVVSQTAELLMKGKVIGICNGLGEVGPRSLGNRSILAKADSKELAKYISEVCKKREWYRPIAPVMLLRNALKVTNQNIDHTLSRYMLADCIIHSQYQEQLLGALHINQTARIQTIAEKSENPFMFDLLEYLESHNIFALINTSFNRAGEPIVHDEIQAHKSAQLMGLDAVILNYKLILFK